MFLVSGGAKAIILERVFEGHGQDRLLPAQLVRPAGGELKQSWRLIVATYQSADLKRSLWQVANSVTPYLALAAIFGLLFTTIGVRATLLVELPLVAAAGAAGVWLFYVQHQFENVYWERHDERDFEAAAMRGSSLYALPLVLQWFSGNIGFHHIHHLAPRIPNYRLPKAFNEQPLFQSVNHLTLLSSLRSLRLRLYDEDARRLIGFRQARPVPASFAGA